MNPVVTRARIAMVVATSTGGVGVHVAALVRYLIEDDWPVTVCAPHSTLELFGFPGARAHAVPIRRAGLELLAVPALRTGTRDAALVHAHGLRAGTAGVLGGVRPLVVTWHNAVLDDGLTGALLQLGERVVARRANVNLAASSDLMQRIRSFGGEVELAPVAAPKPTASRSVADVRAELGVGADTPLILSVGRLHRQKAHDVLIHAATHWSRRSPQPITLIAGDGPQHRELSELIATTLAPVRLLGRRSDVADLLRAADVVVLASRWEARPLVVQEAMALGRPVVATDVGGVAELVGDGALLVPAGEVAELADAVARLLDEPAARAELAGRAVAQAGGWPDESDTARACVAVYRRLLG